VALGTPSSGTGLCWAKRLLRPTKGEVLGGWLDFPWTGQREGEEGLAPLLAK